MRHPPGIRTGFLLLVALAGCHLQAGLGPPPAAPPAIEHSIIRDTIESKDGTKTVNETDRRTTTFDDGRSTTLQTNNMVVTQPDGTQTRKGSQTTIDRSADGAVSSSTTSTTGN